jgi:outer membrane protein assembly factor BamE
MATLSYWLFNEHCACKRATATRPGIESMRIFLTLLAAIVIAGCKQNTQLPAIISPYKIDIQQGNVVTQEMVGKLKAGMTRSQVRFVLGSPLVIDMFHADRWDYIYLMQRQGKPDERRRLTVIFDGDKLQTLEGDVEMTDQAQVPTAPAPKPPLTATPPATKPAAAKPPVPPVAPAAELKKPVEKPPVAATPIAKPEAKPENPVVANPAVAKPDAAASEATSTPPADAARPDAAKTETTNTDATKTDTTKAEATKLDATKPDAAKSDAKAGAAAGTKPDPAKAGDKKDAPKERGLFGKMLEKIGM